MVVQEKADFMNIGTLSMDYKSKCIETAIKNNKNYIVVICDTFDYEDYPVFAETYEEAIQQANEYDKKSMQEVMGIYNISK